VIHRDIKPGNMLLDEDGNAYLADFGIAKDLMTVKNGHTSPDGVVGSLDYISPEQARSEAVTPRTDIYSLGVTLYEMITGEHPFKDCSSVERLYKHLNEPLPSIVHLPEDMRDTVNEIIQRATAKNPDQRYPDVLALAVAFREVIGRGDSARALNVIEQLTWREQEVLQLITEGRSNKEIADKLFVTLATVRWHIRQVYKKLGVRSRVQAIIRARELDLIVGADVDVQPVKAPATVISLPEPENPYKGLHAFETTDSRDFFGRCHDRFWLIALHHPLLHLQV
jgi:serine/threonine protein kinase